MNEKHSLIERVGALHALLEHIFLAEYRGVQGHLNVPKLAKSLEVAPETLYRGLRKNLISPKLAIKIIKLSHAGPRKLYWSDMIQFVLPSFEKYRAPKPPGLTPSS